MNQYNIQPSVGFIEAIKMAFKNYANFKGRSRRSEYWFFFLFNFIISSIIIILMIVTIKKVETSRYSYPYVYYYRYYKVNPFVSVLSYIQFFGMIVPILSVQVRRLHDIGKSGVYLFFYLIPLVGTIIIIIYFCKDSEPGNNLYGPSPKYLMNEGTPIYNPTPLVPNSGNNDTQLNVNPQQETYLQPQENMINPQFSQ